MTKESAIEDAPDEQDSLEEPPEDLKEKSSEEKEGSEEIPDSFNGKTFSYHKLVVDKQHDRHQHIQSLARGLFGTLIAIFAALASIYITFSGRLHPFPSKFNSQFKQEVAHFPIDPTIAFLTVMFNQLIFYLLLLVALSSFVTSIITMFDVFIDKNPPSGIALNPEDAPATGLVESNNSEAEQNSSIRIVQGIITSNRSKIDQAQRMFREGALRVLFFGMTIVVALSIYYYAVRIDLWGLIFMDLLFILPGGLFTRFWYRPDDESESSNCKSLGEELMRDDGERLQDFELSPKEEYISSLLRLYPL